MFSNGKQNGDENPRAKEEVFRERAGVLEVYGPVTRKYLTVFEKFCDKNRRLGMVELRQAANQLKLFPTRSQLYSMLKHGNRTSNQPPSEDTIGFGEFCVFATELEEHYQKSRDELPGSKDPRYHNGPATHHHRRTSNTCMSKFDVFLGGSCNPTTWRRDTAIPVLTTYNLSFYNPQVETWTHDLIAIEDEAKELAELLLFVIDSSTRSVASLVEAAYLSGGGRPLVLVMKGLPTKVDGENISDNESRDLKHSHAFLCDLVERQWCPIFEDLRVALYCIAKVLTRGLHLSKLSLEDGAQPVKHPTFKIGDKLVSIKDAFREIDSEDSGRISLSNAFLAIRALTGNDLTVSAYDQIVAVCRESSEQTRLDFNEFCCLVTEYKFYQPPPRWGTFSKVFPAIYRWLSTLKPRPRSREDVYLERDVFLGGTCLHTTWRKAIAIPLLEEHGLTYFDPMQSNWNMSFIPVEAKAKETSLYLLFVISASARGIASMIEVAHYIGQGRKVVLCVQHMKSGVCVYGEQLSERAVGDYNRARDYLADLALRQGVPLFEDIKESIRALVGNLKEEQNDLK